MENCRIETKRCVLKPLTLADATPDYLSWFSQAEIQQHIASAPEDVAALQAFIQQCLDDDAVLLFGIFAEDNRHIGNIKFQFLDKARKNVDMGILIGAAEWRGKQLAGEVISAGGKYLAQQFGTEKIVLGVGKANSRAISAYQNMGFAIEPEPLSPIDYETGILMSWQIN